MTGSQRTLRRPAAVTGFGYWSGVDVTVEFRPAPADSGIVFVRRDLGSDARIPASTDFRIPAERRTNLRRGDAQVDMVEHILAALNGMAIDNCEVHVDAQEMPGCDGSSLPFAEAIEDAGAVTQSSSAKRLVVDRVARVGDEASWVEARPAAPGELVIEFRLDYPNCPAIGRQTARVTLTRDTFLRDLAPCRTFVLASEADQLQQSGRGTRVTTQDLLVFDQEGPRDNVLRYANECARHKALDVLGDLALTGRRLEGEFTAYRSGHRYNAELAAQLLRRTASNADRVAA
ncbi:MAG: UDP-3-O-[3-hydroxymyristoyl] N-acetylglucosamine deacetylase [Planctomycetales bacterium]|nr:UDP-3-O-[3-hydroxymyristoyl] N-acetylglucosamine deacetylase [Planctomycetales bacterium]